MICQISCLIRFCGSQAKERLLSAMTEPTASIRPVSELQIKTTSADAVSGYKPQLVYYQQVFREDSNGYN
ncbi:hypothetical protein L1987_52571 [Smallanthus sonchifolius]|uniref:Uncharacterized protein n=1 Tax=Smallanthus sonchifolius TaxID=185202 RepID=A0ACB9EU41_9ASTR|nr:hypothetical protein L1987_52571 [Smallanthus sonchifolius]